MKLLAELGFRKAAVMKLADSGRLDRSFAKRIINPLIYVWVIERTIVYVGQTKNLYKRMDTYCNGKYWKNSNPSNVAKSKRLEEAVHNKKRVKLFVKPSSDLDKDESEYIRLLKPNWNIRGKNETPRNRTVQPSNENLCFGH